MAKPGRAAAVGCDRSDFYALSRLRPVPSAAQRIRQTAMSFLAFLPVIVCLGLWLIPACLLRRSTYARAQDYFVSSEHTPPGVIQNSSIAYALQMATFGPFFGWGASGDFWPAIINSLFFGLGVYLIYILRRPVLEFLGDALSRGRSVTVHEFIAQQHGSDPRVRLLASSLTVFAFLGLAITQILALAVLLKPMLSGGAASTYLFVGFMLLMMVSYTVLSGNAGVMRSVQLQLGMLYLGLFGSTALLLYLLTSALKPMPPHGTFAVVFVAACCAIMLCYRRSRYVDTSPIRTTSDDVDLGRESPGARLFIRFEKVLNVCVSVFAVLVIVVSAMGLAAEGFSRIVHDGAVALQAGTHMSGLALTALFLLPLFYPIVDLTNWQRIAAFEKDAASSELAPRLRAAALGKIFRTYAVESFLVWMFMCMFGAIAVAATTAATGGDDVLQTFLQQLASEQNPVAAAALSLLLISLFAAVSSTTSSMFSASLCTIRYDILPAFWPELAADKTRASQEESAARRTVLAGVGLYLAVGTAYYVADAHLQISFTSNKFLALLFVLYCAQLSLVPLVLGPVIGRAGGGSGSVSSGWALVIMSASAAAGVGAVSVYLTIGDELWLWAAVPACLASGLLLFAAARLRSAATARAA